MAILDEWGRQLFCEHNAAFGRTFRVPASGSYFVQVGAIAPARKVAVVR